MTEFKQPFDRWHVFHPVIHICFMILFALSWGVAQGSTTSFGAEDFPFFDKEVRPVLQSNCAVCHDSNKHTSDFRWSHGSTAGEFYAQTQEEWKVVVNGAVEESKKLGTPVYKGCTGL